MTEKKRWRDHIDWTYVGVALFSIGFVIGVSMLVASTTDDKPTYEMTTVTHDGHVAVCVVNNDINKMSCVWSLDD